MTHFIIYEGGDRVGYVDTDVPEYEYDGAVNFLDSLLDDQVGKYVGPPSDDWSGPDQHMEGERLDRFVRNLPDDETFEGYLPEDLAVEEVDEATDPPR